MPRRIVDMNGTSIDVNNIKYFEKVERSYYYDNSYGIKLIFWSNATKIIWYRSEIGRNSHYNWLVNNL